MSPNTWFKVQFQILLKVGLIQWAAHLKSSVVSKWIGDDPSGLLIATRISDALTAALGLGLVVTAWRHFPPAPSDAPVALALVVLGTGLGMTLALKGFANYIVTYNSSLVILGFRAAIAPSLIRLGVIAAAMVGTMYSPPNQAPWMLASFGCVAWVVWPLFDTTVRAGRSNLHNRSKFASIQDLLAASERELSPDQRKALALHEAGHTVFMGLGRTLPEDLYAWISDELQIEDAGQFGNHLAGGAMQSFTAMHEHTVLIDLRKPQFLTILGLLCGGAAAEIFRYGAQSVGTWNDMKMFEDKARLYLSIFPEPRFPYLMTASNEGEHAANAKSLTAFRDWVLEQAVVFVRQNEKQLLAVENNLVEHGEATVDSLHVALYGVTPTDTFQQFEWPAHIPAWQYSSANTETNSKT